MAVKIEEGVLADTLKSEDDRRVKSKKITLIYNLNPENRWVRSSGPSWENNFDGVWVAEDAY